MIRAKVEPEEDGNDQAEAFDALRKVSRILGVVFVFVVTIFAATNSPLLPACRDKAGEDPPGCAERWDAR